MYIHYLSIVCTLKIIIYICTYYINMNKIKGEHISWNILEPLDTIKWYDTISETIIPIQESILNSDVGIKRGDVVALLVHDNKPIVTEKIIGKLVLKNILQSIYRGLNKILHNTSDNAIVIYPLISGYLSSTTRLDKIKKFENNELYVKDIIGTYT